MSAYEIRFFIDPAPTNDETIDEWFDQLTDAAHEIICPNCDGDNYDGPTFGAFGKSIERPSGRRLITCSDSVAEREGT